MKLTITTKSIPGYEIEVIVEPKIGDAGIGHYEFWGAKGFDSHPCVDEFEIIKIKHVEHDEYGELSSYRPENKMHYEVLKDKLYDSDEFFEQVVEAWKNCDYESKEPDYYPPEEK